ncbi:N-acetylglucosamine-6-phosphate deacetylase [Candidatus Izimaplasma bacterium HR1]|jgi:N-acetylglucosamine-6-phosphate deacetylase|uniref:N-acetylglucosamine-6-phosphate deacetylase n=1 Tax=Candidatus Izimoplasma sp. HR1 TaxID=1541959 RepID=UPI0004F6AACC|nr:N-acetylglucosamine-6-phosphate deacetylase [Candidatus Izimaplasma bacterium HR1]
MKVLKNLRIFTEDGIVENGFIRFDTLIREIGQGDVEGEDMNGKTLIPGFVDQHIHGLLGHDIMDGNYEGLNEIATNLPKEGTTSFLATTMTETKENIIKALRNIRNYNNINQNIGAEILGVHLEGPFISSIYKGAQREDAIQDISIELFDEYYQASGELIKQVTIAPELNNANKLIKHMVRKDVVASIGHSNTSGEEALEAIKNGAKCFTHAYNGMSKLHHRNIGAVGAMFLSDTYSELICDRIHTSDNATRLLYKVKTSDKLILITDSMRAKLLGDGEYELGGQKVIVNNSEARLEDGVLAGSTLFMNEAIKNMQDITECGIYELIKMSSSNPAILHNVYDRKGSIKVGKDADLLVIKDDLSIDEVYCKGTKTA